MASVSSITATRVRELLCYCPETGVFTWRVDHGRACKAGQVAGSVDKSTGYSYVVVDYTKCSASRLAFLYMRGVWPQCQVDHVDLNPLNNAWANLREASPSQNQWNRGVSRTNTSGVKGVTWCRQTGKWRASIGALGKSYALGRFQTLEQAKAAYVAAAHQLHGEYARTA